MADGVLNDGMNHVLQAGDTGDPEPPGKPVGKPDDGAGCTPPPIGGAGSGYEAWANHLRDEHPDDVDEQVLTTSTRDELIDLHDRLTA